jgi:hypothetical protein
MEYLMFSFVDKFSTTSTLGSLSIALVGTSVMLATLVLARLDLDERDDAGFIIESLREHFGHKLDEDNDLTGEVPFQI